MKNLPGILLFFLLSNPCMRTYAQTLVPECSADIDKTLLEGCIEEVERINSLELKCDTLFDHRQTFDRDYYVLWVDGLGRLRKYSHTRISNDGTHENGTRMAYYDPGGEVVYIYDHSDSHCDWRNEYYYLHGGRIVDFRICYSCGCCEDEEVLTESQLTEMLNGVPLVGQPAGKWAGWIPISDYLTAETILWNIFKDP
ncbi:MAG: hypothetical protein LUE10_07455 [Alistipes sp.]|nr:hypothetical protein [Alistipes sp.]